MHTHPVLQMLTALHLLTSDRHILTKLQKQGIISAAKPKRRVADDGAGGAVGEQEKWEEGARERDQGRKREKV